MGHVVVGGERFVAKFYGTSWNVITPGDAWYEPVWMRAPGDVWVVGDDVLMSHAAVSGPPPIRRGEAGGG